MPHCHCCDLFHPLKERLQSHNYTDKIYTSQLRQYFKNLFDTDSDLYIRLKSELFWVDNAIEKNIIRDENVVKGFQYKFPLLIDSAIETIESFGIDRIDPFIVRFIKKNPALFWTIVGTIISLTATGAFFVGKWSESINSNKEENRIIRIESELKNVRDSIFFSDMNRQNSKDKSDSDTTKH